MLRVKRLLKAFRIEYKNDFIAELAGDSELFQRSEVFADLRDSFHKLYFLTEHLKETITSEDFKLFVGCVLHRAQLELEPEVILKIIELYYEFQIHDCDLDLCNLFAQLTLHLSQEKNLIKMHEQVKELVENQEAHLEDNEEDQEHHEEDRQNDEHVENEEEPQDETVKEAEEDPEKDQEAQEEACETEPHGKDKSEEEHVEDVHKQDHLDNKQTGNKKKKEGKKYKENSKNGKQMQPARKVTDVNSYYLAKLDLLKKAEEYKQLRHIEKMNLLNSLLEKNFK